MTTVTLRFHNLVLYLVSLGLGPLDPSPLESYKNVNIAFELHLGAIKDCRIDA